MRAIDYILLAGLALALVGGAWFVLGILNAPDYSPASPADTLDVFREPLQGNEVKISIPTRKRGGTEFYIMPVASYQISGILVAKKAYGGLSRINGIVPWDYGIAWGQTTRALPSLRFWMGNRYLNYRARRSHAVDQAYLQSHVSNSHLIPANANIRRAMALAKRGREVRLTGYLVDIQGLSGGKRVQFWNTSLIREDTGMGACEIVYVTELRLGDRVYR